MAAARGIAAVVPENELREDHIIPSPFNRDVPAAVAAAVAEQATREGTAEADPGRVGYAPGDTQEFGRRPAVKRITVTGGTGRLGSLLVDELRKRGDEVTVLSRTQRRRPLGPDGRRPRPPRRSPAATPSCTSPASTSCSAGTTTALRRIRESREIGTRNLVAGMRAAEPRPAALISRRRPSATTATARTRSTRTPRPATTSWPRSARPGSARPRRPRSSACASCACAPASCSTARPARSRRCCCRSGSASAARWPAGRQPMPWIHLEDVIGIYLAAIDDERWSGPVHATAPQPVSNREFSKALGRALHRPAIVPVPALRPQGPLRRDVEAGARGPERRPPPHHRARVPPPAPGPRRGAALRAAGHLTTAQGSLVKSAR